MEEVCEFLAVAREIVKFVIENGDNLTKAVKITIQIIKESGELVQMVAHLAREHGPALLQMLKHRTKASLQAAKSGIRALSDQTAFVAKNAARDFKQFLQHDVKKHLLHPVCWLKQPCSTKSYISVPDADV